MVFGLHIKIITYVKLLLLLLLHAIIIAIRYIWLLAVSFVSPLSCVNSGKT